MQRVRFRDCMAWNPETIRMEQNLTRSRAVPVDRAATGRFARQPLVRSANGKTYRSAPISTAIRSSVHDDEAACIASVAVPLP